MSCRGMWNPRYAMAAVGNSPQGNSSTSFEEQEHTPHSMGCYHLSELHQLPFAPYIHGYVRETPSILGCRVNIYNFEVKKINREPPWNELDARLSQSTLIEVVDLGKIVDAAFAFLLVSNKVDRSSISDWDLHSIFPVSFIVNIACLFDNVTYQIARRCAKAPSYEWIETCLTDVDFFCIDFRNYKTNLVEQLVKFGGSGNRYDAADIRVTFGRNLSSLTQLDDWALLLQTLRHRFVHRNRFFIKNDFMSMKKLNPNIADGDYEKLMVEYCVLLNDKLEKLVQLKDDLCGSEHHTMLLEKETLFREPVYVLTSSDKCDAVIDTHVRSTAIDDAYELLQRKPPGTITAKFIKDENDLCGTPLAFSLLLDISTRFDGLTYQIAGLLRKEAGVLKNIDFYNASTSLVLEIISHFTDNMDASKYNEAKIYAVFGRNPVTRELDGWAKLMKELRDRFIHRGRYFFVNEILEDMLTYVQAHEHNDLSSWKTEATGKDKIISTYYRRLIDRLQDLENMMNSIKNDSDRFGVFFADIDVPDGLWKNKEKLVDDCFHVGFTDVFLPISASCIKRRRQELKELLIALDVKHIKLWGVCQWNENDGTIRSQESILADFEELKKFNQRQYAAPKFDGFVSNLSQQLSKDEMEQAVTISALNKLLVGVPCCRLGHESKLKHAVILPVGVNDKISSHNIDADQFIVFENDGVAEKTRILNLVRDGRTGTAKIFGMHDLSEDQEGSLLNVKKLIINEEKSEIRQTPNCPSSFGGVHVRVRDWEQWNSWFMRAENNFVLVVSLQNRTSPYDLSKVADFRKIVHDKLLEKYAWKSRWIFRNDASITTDFFYKKLDYTEWTATADDEVKKTMDELKSAALNKRQPLPVYVMKWKLKYIGKNGRSIVPFDSPEHSIDF